MSEHDPQLVEELAQLLHSLFGVELDKERFRAAAVEVLDFLADTLPPNPGRVDGPQTEN